MSDDEYVSRQSKHLKTSAFTMIEKKQVMKLVNLHYDVLSIKVMNNITINQKREAWKAIYKAFLENTKFIKQHRTLKQVQKCWYNIRSKAKNGEPEAVKLMQYITAQNNLLNEKICTSKDVVNGSTVSLDSDDSDAAPIFDCEKPEDIQNSSKQSVDQNFLKTKGALNNRECTHCECEKKAKVQLVALQKRLSEELHELEMHIIKERLKNESELHKLHVQEMSLKIENERKRAVILDNEMEKDSCYSKKTFVLTSYQTYSTN